MLKRASLLILLAGLFLFSQGSTVAQTTGKTMILIGGGDFATEAPEIVDEIIQYAGGVDTARIGIITAASIPESQDPNANNPRKARNSVSNAAFYADLFMEAGAADAQWIPIDLDNISNNSDPTVVAQINSMTGFFIGGGDQSRLITTFMLNDGSDSPALAALRQKYNNGAVLAGTSAGTAIQVSAPMVTGGESYYALRYGSATSSSYSDDLTYDPAGGFGFFNYGLLDTHFSERGRQGRIIRLGWDTYTDMVYGVDESTALIVTHADTIADEMRVTGKGGVFIADLSQASSGNGSYWSIYDVSVSYLTEGDVYDPTTHSFTFASWKSSLTGREYYSTAMSPTDDIFSSPDNYRRGSRVNPREFAIVSTDLFDSQVNSTYGVTYESGPAFVVDMIKSSSLGSEGFQGYLNGQNYYAYKNLLVDMSQQ